MLPPALSLNNQLPPVQRLHSFHELRVVLEDEFACPSLSSDSGNKARTMPRLIALIHTAGKVNCCLAECGRDLRLPGASRRGALRVSGSRNQKRATSLEQEQLAELPAEVRPATEDGKSRKVVADLPENHVLFRR
jgi:hypothetical protein